MLHIFIRPREGVTTAEIEQKLDLGLEWIRYAPGSYVVYTSKTPKDWQARLKPFVDPGGHLFILSIDPDEFTGWMPKSIWTWMKARKKDIYGDE